MIREGYSSLGFPVSPLKRGQRYIFYPNGQMRRILLNGKVPLPRVRMSKKERLRLRREHQDIRGMDQKDLAEKIIGTPVINPVPELKEQLVKKSETEVKNA